MSKIERFEDLIAWQKARELTASIYRITRQGSFAKDFGLSGQIQRAAVSTMSNIARGNAQLQSANHNLSRHLIEFLLSTQNSVLSTV